MVFTYTELKEAQSELNYSSSLGTDGITYYSLTNIIKKAHLQLLHFFISWETGVIPADCKISRIVLILKSGKSHLSISSHHPVALASCLGKLIERMILFFNSSGLWK